MAHDHVIAPGDHIVRLAYLQGMREPERIWDDPKNASLRKKRSDPAVLAPGDVVHVPDAPVWRFDNLATGQEHTVVLDLAVAWLRVRLRHPGGAARAGKLATVGIREEHGDKPETKVFETDSDGLVEVELGPFTQRIDLSIDEVLYVLHIARLEPVESTRGLLARLANLGYAPGAIDGAGDPYARRSACEEFQCDHGLKVDGDPGPKTRAKLVEVHGA
jgi:hypothetical protein